MNERGLESGDDKKRMVARVSLASEVLWARRGVMVERSPGSGAGVKCLGQRIRASGVRQTATRQFSGSGQVAGRPMEARGWKD